MGTWKYSAEFQADAVELVRSSGRPIAQVAKLARLREQVSRFRFVEDQQRAVGPKRLYRVRLVEGISTTHAESGGAYGDLGCTAAMSVICPAPATSASQ